MENNEVPRITCEDLKRLIDKGEKLVIIDTRTNSSYREEHIKGAINIYYNPGGDPVERAMTFTALPADRPLVIYCDCTDESDSGIMAQELKYQRYDIDDVRVLKQGFMRWKDLGYPTEKSEY
jgi:rhodanese-related sulfurtransferase